MNTVLFVKSLRYVLSKDSTLQTLMGETSEANMRNNRLFYKDTTYVDKDDGFKYPAITIKTDDDDPVIRGIGNNVLFIELTVHNKYNNPNAQTVNLNIKDRLKLILNENHESLNAQAQSFSAILKCRDLAWVSAITYDDKTQGSERVHKNICTLKAIVGD